MLVILEKNKYTNVLFYQETNEIKFVKEEKLS